MPFNLGFQTKHILNPCMHFNPVKVSFNDFTILSKTFSAHCEGALENFHRRPVNSMYFGASIFRFIHERFKKIDAMSSRR